jgi:hypothetical protein
VCLFFSTYFNKAQSYKKAFFLANFSVIFAKMAINWRYFTISISKQQFHHVILQQL